MQLSVRDVAEIMRAPESEVLRWVRDDRLPARLFDSQLRIDRSELIEWATLRRIDVPRGLFGADANRHAGPRLADAIRRGQVFHDVPAVDINSALAALIERAPVARPSDRLLLIELLKTREAFRSTGVGDGIAIPHPRHPLVVAGDGASVTICFLEKHVDFRAPDHRPVHTLFGVLSSSQKLHLQVLARLATALRDGEFRRLVERQAQLDDFVARAAELDAEGQSP